jgi:hypothetical protein
MAYFIQDLLKNADDSLVEFEANTVLDKETAEAWIAEHQEELETPLEYEGTTLTNRYHLLDDSAS